MDDNLGIISSLGLMRYLAVPEDLKSYGEVIIKNRATNGLVIAPDYQGFGVRSDMPQAYLAQELTARQTVDAMRKGLELYQQLVTEDPTKAPVLADTWFTYAFGFSQGGAVALATQRYIEQNGLSTELRYGGTFCGEGPYDLITTLKYYFENGNKTTMPVVIPMIIQGMLATDPTLNGCQLTDFLSEQFLDTGIMDWLAAKDKTTDDIKSAWKTQRASGLSANGRTYTPSRWPSCSTKT